MLRVPTEIEPFRLVFVPHAQRRGVRAEPVGPHRRPFRYVPLRKSPYRFPADVLKDAHLHELGAISGRAQRHRHLNGRLLRPPPAFPAFLLPTDVRLVRLHYPGQQVPVVTLAHPVADLVQHQPRGGIGHTQLLLQPRRGHAQHHQLKPQNEGF